jgi:hypothetical protein
VSALSMIGSIPGVKSAVLGDLGGALLDALREPESEAVAAEMGFLGATVIEAGEQLGLGALQRIVLAGPARAAVVVVRDRQVLAARVDPPRALAAVEKSILAAFTQGA